MDEIISKTRFQYTRAEVIDMLHEKKGADKHLYERAALLLERDTIQIHDLELKIMGMKVKAKETAQTISSLQAEIDKMKEGQKDGE